MIDTIGQKPTGEIHGDMYKNMIFPSLMRGTQETVKTEVGKDATLLFYSLTFTLLPDLSSA